jgi:hypothetical protein
MTYKEFANTFIEKCPNLYKMMDENIRMSIGIMNLKELLDNISFHLEKDYDLVYMNIDEYKQLINAIIELPTP